MHTFRKAQVIPVPQFPTKPSYLNEYPTTVSHTKINPFAKNQDLHESTPTEGPLSLEDQGAHQALNQRETNLKRSSKPKPYPPYPPYETYSLNSPSFHSFQNLGRSLCPKPIPISGKAGPSIRGGNRRVCREYFAPTEPGNSGPGARL